MIKYPIKKLMSYISYKIHFVNRVGVKGEGNYKKVKVSDSWNSSVVRLCKSEKV